MRINQTIDHLDPVCKPATYASKQVFFQASTDGSVAGWYLTMGGQATYGPFPHKRAAQRGLVELIRARLESKYASKN